MAIEVEHMAPIALNTIYMLSTPIATPIVTKYIIIV